jgi:lysyl-tRNA synthetase class 2
MSSYSDESLVRLEKINRMRALGIIPYANKYDKKDNIDTLMARAGETFRSVEEVTTSPQKIFSTAGRVMLFRSFGKIAFAHLQDATGVIQVMFSRDTLSINTGKELKERLSEEMTAFKFIEKLVDLGDFIGVK